MPNSVQGEELYTREDGERDFQAHRALLLLDLDMLKQDLASQREDLVELLRQGLEALRGNLKKHVTAVDDQQAEILEAFETHRAAQVRQAEALCARHAELCDAFDAHWEEQAAQSQEEFEAFRVTGLLLSSV